MLHFKMHTLTVWMKHLKFRREEKLFLLLNIVEKLDLNLRANLNKPSMDARKP
ncbi:hypothetical protein [Wolbachia endosymbiont of Litomosoides brasiliensis]|uniref:hypothetical protein n=1 Tax=Wolbachia endosymbiont of Litomosoides brasiliensis TaxID=1812117 RepID=UPI003978E131